MSIQAIAQDLVTLCRAGKPEDVQEKHYSEDIISVEAGGPPGMDPVARGKAALAGKTAWWASNHEVKNAEVDGPYINGEQFTVRFTMDVVVKATGQEMHMSEVGLYTVKDDKVVEERFFYGM